MILWYSSTQKKRRKISYRIGLSSFAISREFSFEISWAWNHTLLRYLVKSFRIIADSRDLVLVLRYFTDRVIVRYLDWVICRNVQQTAGFCVKYKSSSPATVKSRILKNVHILEIIKQQKEAKTSETKSKLSAVLNDFILRLKTIRNFFEP